MPPVYSAPLVEVRFVLESLVDYPATIASLPGYEDAGLDEVMEVLGQAATFCSDVLLPLNRIGDEQGCELDGATVRTPAGFDDAFRAVAGGGWCGLSASAEYGGAGLPQVAQAVLSELRSSTDQRRFFRLPHPRPRRLSGARPPRLGGAARPLPTTARIGGMDGHDVSDRGTRRH
jgi:alkylation response protein AidB-like acyl-CoA dehydrogenase